MQSYSRILYTGLSQFLEIMCIRIKSKRKKKSGTLYTLKRKWWYSLSGRITGDFYFAYLRSFQRSITNPNYVLIKSYSFKSKSQRTQFDEAQLKFYPSVKLKVFFLVKTESTNKKVNECPLPKQDSRSIIVLKIHKQTNATKKK